MSSFSLSGSPGQKTYDYEGCEEIPLVDDTVQDNVPKVGHHQQSLHGDYHAVAFLWRQGSQDAAYLEGDVRLAVGRGGGSATPPESPKPSYRSGRTSACPHRS